MKILVICQHYWPEPYPLADVCEELVRRGHTVHVVTGVPNYPMGVIYPEYTKGRGREQVHNGVRITRTFTIGRRQNLLFRFLNYYSYAISSTLYVRSPPGDYDVVFTNQTSPVMMSAAAMAYGRKHGKKVVLYCMDLWPASLAAGGVDEHSVVHRFFSWMSGCIYRRADRILITSEMFRTYLKDKFGIDEDRIRYHPQYADSRFDYLETSVEKDTVDLMFAGNVGKAQSLPTILGAVKRLENHRELRWHIIGDGSELENTRALAEELGLENVIFHGRKPLEEMPRYYAMADAMLVTLMTDPFISLTLPGKVQTYMAAGKPIIGAADGEIHSAIIRSGCGFCAPADDPAALAEAVEEFLSCRDKAALGRNARKYYEENFTRQRFMDNLERELTQYAEK